MLTYAPAKVCFLKRLAIFIFYLTRDVMTIQLDLESGPVLLIMLSNAGRGRKKSCMHKTDKIKV